MNTDLMHQCVWGVYVLCMGLLGVDMSYLFIISACVYMHGITVVQTLIFVVCSVVTGVDIQLLMFCVTHKAPLFCVGVIVYVVMSH